MEEAVRIPGAKSGSPPQKWEEHHEATQGGYTSEEPAAIPANTGIANARLRARPGLQRHRVGALHPALPPLPRRRSTAPVCLQPSNSQLISSLSAGRKRAEFN